MKIIEIYGIRSIMFSIEVFHKEIKMRKFPIYVLSIAVLSLAIVGCSKKIGSATNSASVRVAMITDSGDITDQSFNQTTYSASKSFCEENNLKFNYYRPAGDSTADRVASINAAIQDDYNVLVLPGYLFAEAIVETAEKNSDIKFIGLDVGEFDVMSSAAAKGKTDWKLPKNVFCAVYSEEIPGFMAGYAAVKEGFRHLGFLGGMAVPAVIRYGFGYIQGINAAAEQMGIQKDVTVEYVYGGQFYGDQQIKAFMDGWYKNRGVEVVFACGGGIWTSAADSAKDIGAKVIGVDVDQSAMMDAYAEGMCVTSAMKGLGATVKSTLKAILTGNWSMYSGKISSLGLVSATDMDANYVQLPTDTWSMKNFSVQEYKALVSDLYNGKTSVSGDTMNVPAHSVVLNIYPNIK